MVLEGQYPKAQINKMMMDASGTGRFYHLQPEQHVALVSIAVEQTEFPTTIHLEFQEGKINGLEATEISKMFEEYGDFFIQKDTPNSIYMEFFFVDPKIIPSKKITDLLPHLLGRPQLGIVQAAEHK